MRDSPIERFKEFCRAAPPVYDERKLIIAEIENRTPC
ncbi:hypothetical protein ABIE53_004658 [Burkholderia sp. OAS925]|nr:hypothetical protein [Paraburkholderia graminis]